MSKKSQREILKLSQICSDNLVILDLKANTQCAAVRELLSPLKKAGLVDNIRKAAQTVLEREQVLTTAIDERVAMPRYYDEANPRCAMAIGISRTGIAWGGSTVHVICLLVLKQAPAPELIRMTFGLVRALSSSRTYSRLLKRNDEASFLADLDRSATAAAKSV